MRFCRRILYFAQLLSGLGQGFSLEKKVTSIMDLPDSIWEKFSDSFVQKDIRDLFELNQVSSDTFPYVNC